MVAASGREPDRQGVAHAHGRGLAVDELGDAAFLARAQGLDVAQQHEAQAEEHAEDGTDGGVLGQARAAAQILDREHAEDARDGAAGQQHRQAAAGVTQRSPPR